MRPTAVTSTPAVPIQPPPRQASPTGRRYVELVLVLGALIALGPLTIDMYLPAFPAMTDDLSTTESGAQFTLTGMLIGLSFGQLVIGPLSDSFGRRGPLILGVLTHAIASVLCAFAPTIVLLSAARVLQGLAGAAISVVAMAIVRDLFDGLAVARLMSRLMLVIGIAPIIAPSLGSLVLEVTSWRGIFMVLAGAALVLVLVAYFGIRETLPRERRRPARVRATLTTYRMLLRDRSFVALVLIGGLMMSALFAYVAGSSFVLQDGYGMDERTFGLVFGANAAGLTIASQVNPTLLRRFGAVTVVSAALVVAVLASAMLIVAGASGVAGVTGVLLPMAVVVALCGLSLPNTPALALTRHGEAAGTAAAMMGFTQFGIGAVVAPLVGLFGGASAVPMGVVMLGVTLLASALMFGVVRRDPTVHALH